MAFLRNYKRDVFISYAHRDNGEGIAEPGWIHAFAKKLEGALKLELESPRSDSLDIFWDYRLIGNEPLPEQLRVDVSHSALFVVIVGKHYSSSTWCQSELDWFSKAVIERCRADSRIFLIRKEPIGNLKLPQAFRNLVGFDFFDESRRPGQATLAWPNAEKIDKDRMFFERLGILATRLAEELRRLDENVDSDRPPAIVVDADFSPKREASVFLALDFGHF